MSDFDQNEKRKKKKKNWNTQKNRMKNSEQFGD